MTTILSFGSPPLRMRRARFSKGLLLAISLGFGAFSVTLAMLPGQTFRAHALIVVADVESPLAGTLARAAAEASLSEPVTRRAVASLIGTNVTAPAPAFVEWLAKVFKVHATDRDAGLAADLVRSVRATPGDASGTLEISARDSDPGRAARLVSAVANSLIADHDEMIARALHRRALDSATNIDRLRLDLTSARKRLAALGTGVDPSDMRTAAQQTAKAQARADAIHAVIASGSPPLSERPSPSAAIETLQSTYLNMSRQLETARETLGDRHVTIISLRAGVKEAAANLTAEWKRLARLADADLATARRREAVLRKSDGVMNGARRDAMDAARRDVRIAETMIARAQATPVDTSNEAQTYWLMSAPTVPKIANGLSGALRAFIACILGLLVAQVVLAWPMLRTLRVPWPGIHRTRGRFPPRFGDTDAIQHGVIDVVALDWAEVGTPAPANADGCAVSNPRGETAASDASFSAGKDGVSIPSVMVATNDAPADTTLVALAIGRAAVDAGLRVLIVEAPKPCPTLAVAVDLKADPEVAGLRGDSRVVLRAEGTAGDLYLAPSFANGAHLAASLLRNDEAPFIDDVGAAFDLIVIDGGRVSEGLAAGWRADSYVRVGTSQSQRGDASFADAFGIPVTTLLETVVISTLAADVARRPVRPRAGKAAPDARWASAPKSGVFVTSSHVPFARPAAAGRTGGARQGLYERR